jgi:hypothetical protein
MDNEYDLEFRDDMSMEPPIQSSEPEMSGGETTQVSEQLASTLTPDTLTVDAAYFVSTLSTADQSEAMDWIGMHFGGLYAAEVFEHLEGYPSGVEEQVDAIATGILVAGTKGLGGSDPEQETEEEKQPQDGRQSLVKYTDPILGEFDVRLDIDRGITTATRGGKVVVTASSGLVIRTPKGMPDLTLRLIELDLATGDVRIISDPDIGPFEERLIGNLLRTTVLDGFDNLDNTAGKASALGLPTNSDGKIIVHDSRWVSVIMDPATQFTASLSGKGIWIFFSEDLFVDVFGPVNIYLSAIFYDFSTGEVSLTSSTEGSMVGVALQRWAADIGEGMASDFLAGQLPAAMKKKGYNPSKDPKLADNFNALLANFTGGKDESGLVAEAQAKTPDAPASLGSREAAGREPSGDGDGSYESLWKIRTEVGEVALAMSKGDELFVERNATHVKFGAPGGIFIVAEGADWTQDLRLYEVSYNLENGEIEIDASEPVGDFVTRTLAGLFKTQLLPKLPVDIKSAVGIGQSPASETADPAGPGERTIYALDVAGVGGVRISSNPAESLRMTADADAVTFTSPSGVRIHTEDATWIPDAVIGSMHYDRKTGAIQVQAPAGGELEPGDFLERILENLVRTHLLPEVPQEVQEQTGLNTDGVQVPKRNGRVLYKVDLGEMGGLDVSIRQGAQISLSSGPEGIRLNAPGGILVRLPGQGLSVNVFDLVYDPSSKTVRSRAEPPLGSYDDALVAGALSEFVLPYLTQHLATHDEDLKDDTNVLYKLSTEALGVVKICTDKGDTLKVTETGKSITVSSQNGIFWLAEGGEMSGTLPTTRLRKITMSLETGEITIDSDKDVGELGEHLATQLVQHTVLPGMSPEVRRQVFGRDPLQTTASENTGGEDAEAPNNRNVLYKSDVPGLGTLEASLKQGDNIGFKSGPTGVEMSVGEGLQVRIEQLGIDVRFFDLNYDPETGLVRGRTQPPLGELEAELIGRALGQFVVPQIQGHLAEHDENLNDETTVLFSFENASLGNVRICMERSDSISVEENADTVSVSSSKGIFYTSSGGEQSDLLPQLRIHRVSLNLNTGDVTIDADKDIGALGEMAATRLLHLFAMPQMSPELRAQVFGGKDPAQAGPAEVPPAGRVLYAGAFDDNAFDLSLTGDGHFSLQSLASGHVRFDGGSGGLLFRVPGLGMAIELMELIVDPATGQVATLITQPEMGPAEMALVQAAATQFAAPMLSEWLAPTPGRESQAGLRSVVGNEYLSVLVNTGESLSVQRGTDAITLSAPSGLLVSNAALGTAPRVQSVRYELGTGRIDIDLVDRTDKSKYRESAEVAAMTELALSNLVRQFLDPHLNEGARELGLTGEETKENMGSLGPRQGEGTPWFDYTDDTVGRMLLYNHADDEVNVRADEQEISVSSNKGIRLVLPDLGVVGRFYRARYDVKTGDFSMDGLGRLENAMIRSRMQTLLVGPIAEQAGVGVQPGQGPIQSLIDQSPKDKKGRYVIEADDATILIPKDPKLRVQINGSLLKIYFDPPIFVDGSGPFNFELEEVGYNFTKGKFEVDVSGSNILASIFSGTADKKFRKALEEMLGPKMPEAMREPGYSFFADRDRADHVAELFNNFGAAGAEKEE